MLSTKGKRSFNEKNNNICKKKRLKNEGEAA
jgi:hypothetical protein